MRKKSSKSKAMTIIALLFVGIGLLCVFYEPIVNFLYQTEQNRIIGEYDRTVEKAEDATESPDNNSNKKKTTSAADSSSNKAVIDYDGLKKAIKEYNKRIYKEGQHGIQSTSSYQTPPINLYNYGFQNTVYGYITIEKIGVNMALYLGASDSNMAMGAATLNYTSIPFGGKNSNPVIAGHCGYGGRNYFRYIETLRSGDKVVITTPFKKLEYRVYDRQVYEPKVLDEIKIQEGRDLITLFTCYPYPTSEKRCCIFCERVN